MKNTGIRYEIIKIIKQSHPDGKGMIIKIVDRGTHAKTGGIVQGMSGTYYPERIYYWSCNSCFCK